VVLTATWGAKTGYLALAPQMEFAALPYSTRYKGRPGLQMDVSYRQDAKGWWTPTEWQFTSLDRDGHLDWMHSAVVRECAVNPSISDAAFDIEFPVGTVVTHEKTHRQFQIAEGGKQVAVVVDGGRIVPLGGGSAKPWLWGVLLAAVAGGAFLAARRLRRRT
jgi:hypothetical protein